jgi:hypothetical protein
MGDWNLTACVLTSVIDGWLVATWQLCLLTRKKWAAAPTGWKDLRAQWSCGKETNHCLCQAPVDYTVADISGYRRAVVHVKNISRVFLDKMTVAQRDKKFSHFMEHEVSLPSLQQHATGPSSESVLIISS